MPAKKNSIKNTSLDRNEAPELTEEYFQRADLFVGDQRIRRWRPAGSVKEHPKAPVKIRLDIDILEALRASGNGWQTRINDAWVRSLAQKLGAGVHEFLWKAIRLLNA